MARPKSALRPLMCEEAHCQYVSYGREDMRRHRIRVHRDLTQVGLRWWILRPRYPSDSASEVMQRL